MGAWRRLQTLKEIEGGPLAWEAAIWLRRHGHCVRCLRRAKRPGRHELDGQNVPTSWLIDMAAMEGFDARGDTEIAEKSEAPCLRSGHVMVRPARPFDGLGTRKRRED